MLLPALMASIGFFFGQTVMPLYFYVSVAILLVCAFVGGWKRGVAYVALLAVCTVLTMFTFSYAVGDAKNYHFPMSHLLRHGWNPVFDSTIEKFYPLVEGTRLCFYHTLFLSKFQQLCGAIMASAFRLFDGEAFLGYVLIVCLFTTCLKFARRYWNSGVWLGLLFACGLTSSRVITLVFHGCVDYSAYASFCVSALSLVLYRNDRKLSDLVLFVVAACVCMTTKTTGIINVGLLVLLTIPLLWRRTAYWHALLALGGLVAVVGASPLLTNWIQYGSPFYPSMTFNPNVPLVDITCDFTGNADALSMGYLSRICYAWVSPKLTVAVIRLLTGNPDFEPVFDVSGGVAGFGLWFNALLLISVVLLALARKNIVTWLCVVIFVTSNFAPLKYIGFVRYFPQIWAIFPLAVMNYLCSTRHTISGMCLKPIRKAVSVVVVFALVGLVGAILCRAARDGCRIMVLEGVRQNLIASLPMNVEVDSESFFHYTVVQRFRQAGIAMSRGANVSKAGVWRLENMPRKEPVTLRLSLPPRDADPTSNPKYSPLLCTDRRTGERFALKPDLTLTRIGSDLKYASWFDAPSKEKLRVLIDYFPHVLWDNGQGGNK